MKLFQMTSCASIVAKFRFGANWFARFYKSLTATTYMHVVINLGVLYLETDTYMYKVDSGLFYFIPPVF